jgi:hypothetical protein
MKLFNMDLHISVIADFKNLFPEIEIVDWCLSGHAFVMKKKTFYPSVINPDTWKNLNEKMISEFHAVYDDFLSQFDGFICGHPNSFAMIFEKYNKPIILINSCRFDLPFCMNKNENEINMYRNCIHRLQEKNLLIAVSNNLADQYYTKYGYHLQTTHIPSLCGYTNIRYQPTSEQKQFLVYTGNINNHPLIAHKNQLNQPFEWSELLKFKGIIHFPYEVSTMSMFEHFSAGIPLFFPSKKYMTDSYSIQSVSAYWGYNLPEYLKIFNDKKIWLDRSDFYLVFQSPNVHYFDSIPHLLHLLESFVWVNDIDIIDKYRKEIKEKWIDILRPILA